MNIFYNRKNDCSNQRGLISFVCLCRASKWYFEWISQMHRPSMHMLCCYVEDTDKWCSIREIDDDCVNQRRGCLLHQNDTIFFSFVHKCKTRPITNRIYLTFLCWNIFDVCEINYNCNTSILNYFTINNKISWNFLSSKRKKYHYTIPSILKNVQTLNFFSKIIYISYITYEIPRQLHDVPLIHRTDSQFVKLSTK